MKFLYKTCQLLYKHKEKNHFESGGVGDARGQYDRTGKNNLEAALGCTLGVDLSLSFLVCK